MGRLLLSLVVLLFSNITYAQSDDVLRLCKDISLGAEKLMEHRQTGAPMAEIMESVARQEEASANLGKIIVKDAYSEPLWRTEEAKQRSIVEFGNKYYLKCLDQMEE